MDFMNNFFSYRLGCKSALRISCARPALAALQIANLAGTLPATKKEKEEANQPLHRTTLRR
jgi:hypothetical protein